MACAEVLQTSLGGQITHRTELHQTKANKKEDRASWKYKQIGNVGGSCYYIRKNVISYLGSMEAQWWCAEVASAFPPL